MSRRRLKHPNRQRVLAQVRKIYIPHGSLLKLRRMKRDADRRRLYSSESQHLFNLERAYAEGVVGREKAVGRDVVLVRKNEYTAESLRKAREALVRKAERLK